MGTLLNASPTAWKVAIKSRLHPMRELLPLLLVYIESETIYQETIHQAGVQSRDLSLVISGRVRIPDNETFEETLDAQSAEIETTLTFAALNTALSGKLGGLTLNSATTEIIEEENERTFAAVNMEYTVKVFTQENSPETLI
ncbi:hypothetical protein [Sedimenticola selenatireducens]|uniref:Uncharacterized protein n=1 Tax=Sedimenticola selenatireducens TaxID=191960 RepID=A0A557SCI6_9GAMM|nr:hypothetical protein [Sedimenticola selenatireducens]TVO75138.1 hypothetical protein FHP88_08990 [Sedimenticola selenatireducens]TVT67007.1 MAG: hypothetical protein FHK78_01365 [Sedimenticola selenatireducens]